MTWFVIGFVSGALVSALISYLIDRPSPRTLRPLPTARHLPIEVLPTYEPDPDESMWTDDAMWPDPDDPDDESTYADWYAATYDVLAEDWASPEDAAWDDLTETPPGHDPESTRARIAADLALTDTLASLHPEPLDG